MSGKIFSAFLIILVAAILFMLPLTGAVYGFKTDVKTQTATITTGAAVTTADIVLSKALYDDDTSTISFTSNISEAPSITAYNPATHTLSTANLTAGVTRALGISYDVDALSSSAAMATIINALDFVWLLAIIAFAPAALAALFLA